MTTIASLMLAGPEGGPGWRTEYERAYALRNVLRAALPASSAAAPAGVAAIARVVAAVRRCRQRAAVRRTIDVASAGASGSDGIPVIPPRDALVRDGIPPEVMAHFRARAAELRAEAFTGWGRALAGSLRGD